MPLNRIRNKDRNDIYFYEFFFSFKIIGRLKIQILSLIIHDRSYSIMIICWFQIHNDDFSDYVAFESIYIPNIKNLLFESEEFKFI